MIYLEASIKVAPGKMNEFMEVFSKEYVSASEKLGRKLTAQWRTIVGTLDEFVDLWAYDDLAHMQRFQEARKKDEEIIKAGERLRSLIAYETIRLLAPTPYSAIT
jgi:hypothetical protein